MDVKHLARHVTEWQVAQNTKIPVGETISVCQDGGSLNLPFLETVVPDGHLGRPDDVVVGEHHTLGVASGAAGVDQGGALVDGDAPQPGVE